MIRDTLRLTRDLAKERLGMNYYARVHGDLLCRLSLPGGAVDPYPLYREVRAKGELSSSRIGAWITPSHRLSDQVLRDRRFGVRSEPYEQLPAAPLGHDEGSQWELSFLNLDPPDHARLRRLASPAFTPKKISGYRDRIERVTHRLLDAAVARGEFDLIRDFAAPLPITVIADLLGIPEADVDTFMRYGRIVGGALDGVKSPMEARRLRDTTKDLNELFADLVRRRTAEPGDDLVSVLVGALGDDKLTPRELLGICRLLLIAGFETTVNLIGNGTFALMRHPDQWKLLRTDPGLAPKLVEEVLRWDAPVQLTSRIAQEDLELAGQRLRKGSFVVPLIGAANRDPEVYGDPDTFDLTREGPEHLAFSGGRHYCLGAPLARLEGTVAFEAIAERLPGLVTNGRVRRRRSLTIHGLSDFPVKCGHG